MFVICTPGQSDAIHEELVALERQLYSELGLHFKVLAIAPATLICTEQRSLAQRYPWCRP